MEKESLLKAAFKDLRLVGVVGSPSSTSSAPLILLEGMEKDLKEEETVAIDNFNGSPILAVCRSGTGINENLKVGFYSPGVAYARTLGKTPSRAKESYHFILSFIGVVEKNSIKPNDTIVAPGSPVYTFKDSNYNPLDFLQPKDYVKGGFLASNENWEVPFDTSFIPYHIFIVGATGSGKSFLARHLVIPLLRKAGYGVLVLDWVGKDYAPFFQKETIPISEIKLDSSSVAQYILDRTNNFGYSAKEHTISKTLETVLEAVWEEIRSKYSSDPDGLVKEIKTLIENGIRGGKKGGELKDYEKLALERLKYLERLTREDVKMILGSKDVGDLKPPPGELRVINMYGVNDVIKLTLFLTLANRLMSLIQKGEDLNLALIIDEAPQYCPHDPKGIQDRTTESIKNLCALGRKHKLCMVLISQGMAGEIGINAAVRRNLNTWFIGQIHPLDFEEARTRLSPYGINPERLLTLNPGMFYFTGKMNPSPTPLLISFKAEGGK
jgi:DNA helicase HerA-like ATPase